MIFPIFNVMEHEYLKPSIEKLLNKFIPNTYPMVESIEVVDLDKKSMQLNITLNDEDIHLDNMYDKEFDPHYLVDYHVKKLLKYFGLTIPYISWDVYNTNGDYLFGFNSEHANTYVN